SLRGVPNRNERTDSCVPRHTSDVAADPPLLQRRLCRIYGSNHGCNANPPAVINLQEMAGVDRDQSTIAEACKQVTQKLMDNRCPFLAQSGHALLHCMSPLSGVKRT